MFLMQDAGRGRHPLHVTGADAAAVAGRIAVLQFALIDDGDGFKAAMRMFADAALTVGRREFCRSGMIQQQKGTQFTAQPVV